MLTSIIDSFSRIIFDYYQSSTGSTLSQGEISQFLAKDKRNQLVVKLGTYIELVSKNSGKVDHLNLLKNVVAECIANEESLEPVPELLSKRIQQVITGLKKGLEGYSFQVDNHDYPHLQTVTYQYSKLGTAVEKALSCLDTLQNSFDVENQLRVCKKQIKELEELLSRAEQEQQIPKAAAETNTQLELAKLQSQYDSLDAEKKTLEQELLTANARLASNKKSLVEKYNEINVLTQQLKTFQLQIELLEKEKTQLEKLYEGVTAECHRIIDRNDDLQAQLSKSQRALVTNNEGIAEEESCLDSIWRTASDAYTSVTRNLYSFWSTVSQGAVDFCGNNLSDKEEEKNKKTP